MAESVPEAKERIRRLMRLRRASLSSHDQILSALALARRLAGLSIDPVGGLLLGTLPHRGEIDATPFLQQWLEAGGRLALPRVNPDSNELEGRCVNHLDQTVMGYRGIAEPDPAITTPISTRSIQFLLIPGCAFDLRGNRLGQGGGHYDRFLGSLDDSAIRVGIAHDFQILPDVPTVKGRDERMDFVVSPVRALQCAPHRGGLAPG